MKSPQEVVDLMFENDSFSKWLGIKILEIEQGKCSLSLVVKKEMLNGFHISHGGIAYSLADSCLAFAANSIGYKAVTIDTSFSYFKKVIENDQLTAISSKESIGSKIGVFSIMIINQHKDKIALMKGTVSISSIEW